MTTKPTIWQISYSNKAKKSALKLPVKAKTQLDLLAKELEISGPFRKNWPHYSPLSKGAGSP